MYLSLERLLQVDRQCRLRSSTSANPIHVERPVEVVVPCSFVVELEADGQPSKAQLEGPCGRDTRCTFAVPLPPQDGASTRAQTPSSAVRGEETRPRGWEGRGGKKWAGRGGGGGGGCHLICSLCVVVDKACQGIVH
eukprot:765260-Hanusia_phi.AAC.5